MLPRSFLVFVFDELAGWQSHGLGGPTSLGLSSPSTTRLPRMSVSGSATVPARLPALKLAHAHADETPTPPTEPNPFLSLSGHRLNFAARQKKDIIDKPPTWDSHRLPID